jgi:NTE family protein
MKELLFRYNKEYLKDLDLFEGMADDFFDDIIQHEKIFYLKPGEEFNLETYQNNERTDIWILTHSHASAMLIKDDQQLYSKSLSVGDAFCNAFGITGKQSYWKVKSLGPCYFMRISITSEEKYLKPEYSLLISRIIRTSFLAKCAIRKSTEIKRIAIIPTQPLGDVGVDEWIQQLMPFFESLGKTLILTPNNIDEVLNIQDTSNLDEDHHEYLFRLINIEKDYEYSLYILNAPDYKWIQFCLRSADRLLFITNGDQPISLNPITEHCLKILETDKTHYSKHLAVLYKEYPQNHTHVNEWKQLLHINRHYNIQFNSKKDLARIVRLLTDKAIAFVLGSGAGRGISHLGVFKALKEANIPVDVICGTSVGALIAAFIAKGLPWDECEQRVKQLLNDLSSIQLGFPILSMVKEKAYKQIIQKTIGPQNIEDYPLNYFCPTVNLHDTNVIIHQDGSGMDIIASSCALPGVFPPIELEENLLIDGGVMEPLPVVPMIELYNPGFIIAVDVTTEVTTKISQRQSSFLKKIWSNLMGTNEKRTLTLIDVVLRMCELNSTQSRKHITDNNLADLLLTPDISNIALIPNPEDVDTIINTAYDTYIPQTAQWRADISKKIPLFDDLMN